MTRITREHVEDEFKRGPIAFLMNAVQLFVLVFGLFFIGVRVGTFKAEFATIQKTVAEIQLLVKNGFEANASEHYRLENKTTTECKRIENALVEHTRKPIR
jgi:hypothetical protein